MSPSDDTRDDVKLQADIDALYEPAEPEQDYPVPPTERET